MTLQEEFQELLRQQRFLKVKARLCLALSVTLILVVLGWGLYRHRFTETLKNLGLGFVGGLLIGLLFHGVDRLARYWANRGERR